jgi:hypothetical protein
MTAWRISRALALAFMSMAFGWWLHGLSEANHTPARTPTSIDDAAAPAPSAPPGPSSDAAPLIALAGDGNITLRVEQRPLEWVLEQIALQAGAQPRELLRAPVSPTPAALRAPATEACIDRTTTTPAADELLRTIVRGDEVSRHDGLLQARGAGIAVPDDTLKTLFETDASDRVRLLAFENWLEGRADNAQSLREALQSAQYLPSAAIQNEARRLLSQLHEVERNAADSVQATSP